MVNLDDLATFENLDPSGLHRRLQGLPGQCRRAWNEAKKCAIPDDWRQCTELIVAGMGGSAIAGDLAADLAGNSSASPIRIVRDFKIPGLSGTPNPMPGCSLLIDGYCQQEFNLE